MPRRPKLSGKVTLTLERGEIIMRAPYDADFVDNFKNEIPREARRWDKDHKVWKIQAAYDKELIEFLEEWFDDVVFVGDEPEVIVVPGDAQSDPYGVILRNVPNDLLRDVCRKALSANHPDRGGNQEDFLAVKAAWDTIKKERKL